MKALLYLPVKKRFLPMWEYYQVEYDTLSEIFSEVIVCTSVIQILKNFRSAKLIYCWWWHRSLPVIIISKIFRIKIFVTGAIHMFDISGGPDFYNSGIFYRFFTKLALALCDKSMFISNDQLMQITSHLYVKDPAVLLSSLTRDSSAALKTIVMEREYLREGYSNDDPIFNFVTVTWHTLSSYKRKGIFEVLEALSILKKNTKHQFRWFIIGASADGIERLSLKIYELKLAENVVLKFDLPYEDKRLLYLKSDLYLQPSYCEGFGNAVLEAMSQGLPALVSRHTAQPEVVGNTGFIVMEIKPERIYNKIIEFINLDVKKKKRLTQDVLDYVQDNFTLEKRVLSFRNLLS